MSLTSHGPRRRALTLTLFSGALLLAATARDATGAAIQATREIPEEQLLDVAIEVLDPGIPDPATAPPKKLKNVFLDLRKSEARYIPIRIKETLESTGHWGAVRVVPVGTSSLDLTIFGEIKESSGLELELKIWAIDVSGRKWLQKRYKGEADHRAYSEEELGVRDPYQALYDQIANDLLAEKQRLETEQFLELRQISELRFAAELAPSLFGDYLDVNGHKYKLNRLPSENDPLMARVARIRERDYMLIDTLNEYYHEFFLSMEDSYDNWRSFSYEEQVALAELRRKARMRKLLGALAIFGALVSDPDSSAGQVARDAALIGGVAAIQSGVNKAKEAKIHIEALGELSASFESEVAPLMIEIEGETVRLTGSREDQYAQWRTLLRQIYAAEIGLPVDPNVATDLSLEDTTG